MEILLYIGLAAILTYLIWGFVVSFQVVLAMGGTKWALRWIKVRYSYKVFYAEVLIFYPMILLAYLFLEVIPYYLFGVKKLVSFDLDHLFERLFQE
ncbi:MAG: hypothetical protein DRG24_02440 [Epsilonproteobacteria bacterium]|nr:MAG: hypothetical protein DRG24_02440 [Campylobacterota bacterium]